MKKLAIACAMLMTLVTASIACDEGNGCAVVLKASDGFWNMRTRPNGPVVTRLYRGDEVEVVRAADSWSLVTFGRFQGWVSNTGLQQITCR
jgi:Bacterial SH3 domain